MPEPAGSIAPSTEAGGVGVIRCRIGSAFHEALPAMVHAIVHHRCELADVDIALMDALGEAITEVVEDVVASRGHIVELALHLDFRGVDVEIRPGGEPAGATRPFVAGTIATAAFDEIVDDGTTGAVRVRHRFAALGAMTTDRPFGPAFGEGVDRLPDPVGFRMSLPPGVEQTRLVRSLLRTLIDFRDEESESRFLLATTEIMVNAVEATRRTAVQPHGSLDPVVVDVPPPPTRHVDVYDAAGGFDDGGPDSNHLGAGLTIARSLVEELSVHRCGTGTRVRLVLGEAAS